MDLKAIEHKMELEWLLEQITVRGKKEKLKTNMPKDGIAAYVWRMARFHGGIDVSLPMTIHFRLANQIEKDIPESKFQCGIFGAFETNIMNKLDDLADKCLDRLNMNPFKALSAWKGLFV